MSHYLIKTKLKYNWISYEIQINKKTFSYITREQTSPYCFACQLYHSPENHFENVKKTVIEYEIVLPTELKSVDDKILRQLFLIQLGIKRTKIY